MISAVENRSEQFPAGRLLANRYEVVEYLGCGGSGAVYLCRDTVRSGSPVALKVLAPRLFPKGGGKLILDNELAVHARLRHRNIVPLYEVVQAGELVAFTMEYMEGGDLAGSMAAQGALAIAQAADILIQICAALNALHRRGMVHCDLKPANILLSSNGAVKLGDFGLALSFPGRTGVRQSRRFGTIDYVSPEYLRTGAADPRSDIFAAGAVGFEMLTGRSPFRGRSVFETLALRLHCAPEPISKFRTDCPIKLSDIILKAMAAKPADRFQSAAEMQRALRAAQPASRVSGRGFLAQTWTALLQHIC